ncbi:MAG: ribbon-helix-helix protein, CopG family [Acidilobaceae archaeon]
MRACLEVLEEARGLVLVEERGRVPRYASSEALVLAERFKNCVVDSVASSEIIEAEHWIVEALAAVEALEHKLALRGVTLPKELKSFVEEPRAHLRKKLFTYTLDLLRGLTPLEEYVSKARAAVTTSLRANMRSLYQVWGLSSILALLAERGFRLAYPEHGYLSFDRSGKQRLGSIPPNAVLCEITRGCLSLFHEAPRPLSWEDSRDLRRIWGLYTALRPDAMVYEGWTLDMVDFSRSPPVRRPSVIIEFKELEEWWERARDLKGYFGRPISAEEWASMWLEGLWEGLAEALGVGRAEARRRAEEGRALRVKEPKLLLLYKSTYKPDLMILVSRVALPQELRRELESEGVMVADGVSFDARRLEEVAGELARRASKTGRARALIEVSADLAEELQELSRAMNVSLEEVLRRAVSLLKSSPLSEQEA